MLRRHPQPEVDSRLPEVAHQLRPVDPLPHAAPPFVEPEVVFVRDVGPDPPGELGDAPHLLRVQVDSLFVLGVVPVAVVEAVGPQVRLSRVVPLVGGLPVVQLLAGAVEIAPVHAEEAVGRLERSARSHRFGVQFQLGRGQEARASGILAGVQDPRRPGPQVIEPEEQPFSGLAVFEHEVGVKAGAAVVHVVHPVAGRAIDRMKFAVPLLFERLGVQVVGVGVGASAPPPIQGQLGCEVVPDPQVVQADARQRLRLRRPVRHPVPLPHHAELRPRRGRHYLVVQRDQEPGVVEPEVQRDPGFDPRRGFRNRQPRDLEIAQPVIPGRAGVPFAAEDELELVGVGRRHKIGAREPVPQARQPKLPPGKLEPLLQDAGPERPRRLRGIVPGVSIARNERIGRKRSRARENRQQEPAQKASHVTAILSLVSGTGDATSKFRLSGYVPYPHDCPRLCAAHASRKRALRPRLTPRGGYSLPAG